MLINRVLRSSQAYLDSTSLVRMGGYRGSASCLSLEKQGTEDEKEPCLDTVIEQA